MCIVPVVMHLELVRQSLLGANDEIMCKSQLLLFLTVILLLEAFLQKPRQLSVQMPLRARYAMLFVGVHLHTSTNSLCVYARELQLTIKSNCTGSAAFVNLSTRIAEFIKCTLSVTSRLYNRLSNTTRTVSCSVHEQVADLLEA